MHAHHHVAACGNRNSGKLPLPGNDLVTSLPAPMNHQNHEVRLAPRRLDRVDEILLILCGSNPLARLGCLGAVGHHVGKSEERNAAAVSFEDEGPFGIRL